MFKPFAIFVSIVLLCFVFATNGAAYTPQYADADQEIPLRWKKKRLQIEISSSLFDSFRNIKSKSDTIGAVKRSLEHWGNVANIEFDYKFSSKRNVSRKGTSGDGVSLITIAPTTENILTFDENIGETSAVTRLFFTAKGEIREADIVLNPILLFSTDGTFGSFDLEATLTHEIGHLLGLGHSKLAGSTMHSHQQKNGFYNLPGFSSRTLSEDDKAGAISLYGKTADDVNCCVEVSGRLSVLEKNRTSSFEIWAEDSASGRVIAGIESDNKGSFSLSGLPKSVYEIFARHDEDDSATIRLGKADLTKNRSKVFTEKIFLQERDFDVNYVGINGQLSNLAVPVSPDNNFVVYVGGKNLSHKNLKVHFHSNKLKVLPDSYLKHDYGSDISVFSFEVEVAENLLAGEYSLYLESSLGRIEHLVGVLTFDGK